MTSHAAATLAVESNGEVLSLAPCRSLRALVCSCLVATGCLSESRAPATTDTSTTPEVTAEPCSSEGARECLSYELAPHLRGGTWSETRCDSDQICTRSTGSCQKGKNTCFGVFLCSLDCDQTDKDCGKRCTDDATVQAIDDIGALNQCQCEDLCWPILCGKLFPWPSYAEISSCVAAGCASEGAQCLGGGATGTDECKSVRDCILACDAGDVFCAEGCFGRGSAEAQVQAGFYYYCVRDACGPTIDSTCLFRAQNNDCADLWNACQGATVEPQ
ncbi:MAG: hypothetical protein U1F43_33915 [Myxococcota bacterium]